MTGRRLRLPFLVCAVLSGGCQSFDYFEKPMPNPQPRRFSSRFERRDLDRLVDEGLPDENSATMMVDESEYYSPAPSSEAEVYSIGDNDEPEVIIRG